MSLSTNSSHGIKSRGITHPDHVLYVYFKEKKCKDYYVRCSILDRKIDITFKLVHHKIEQKKNDIRGAKTMTSFQCLYCYPAQLGVHILYQKLDVESSMVIFTC